MDPCAGQGLAHSVSTGCTLHHGRQGYDRQRRDHSLDNNDQFNIVYNYNRLIAGKHTAIMEAITQVKLNATLKRPGGEVWEMGVYDAPIDPELISEAMAGSTTRHGMPIVEVLQRQNLQLRSVVPPPEAPTSISGVTTSNLREGPIFEKSKGSEKKRKSPASKAPKLTLRR